MKTTAKSANGQDRPIQSSNKSTKQKILDAAKEKFLNQGYSHSNLDDIASLAGVTKPTVYSHFHSKEGLFQAVIRQQADQRMEMLDEILTPSDDLRKDLIRFGEFFLARVLSEYAQRWHRLAASEAKNYPEVGRAFYEGGPARVLKKVTQYLKTQKANQRLNFPDATRAAEQLLGMFLTLDLLRTQIGNKPPTPAQQKRRCREAVDVFLAAYES